MRNLEKGKNQEEAAEAGERTYGWRGLEREYEGEEEANSKILRRDQDSFTRMSANVAREAAEVYRDELLDKGEYSSEQIEELVARKRHEVVEEMVRDYFDMEESEAAEEGEPFEENKMLGEASEKELFGLWKRELERTDIQTKERLENCGISYVNLEGVQKEYQEMIAENVEEMCESYPELRGYISSIRSCEMRDSTLARTTTAIGKYGYCVEIQVNQKLFGKNSLESTILDMESANWRGESYLAGSGRDALLKHEMAHVLHLRLIAEEQGLVMGSDDRELFDGVKTAWDRNHIAARICYDTMKEQNIKAGELAQHLSVYGAHDFGECFAEAISEYETSRNPRPFAVGVYRKYEAYKRRIHENDHYTI